MGLRFNTSAIFGLDLRSASSAPDKKERTEVQSLDVSARRHSVSKGEERKHCVLDLEERNDG